MKKIALYCRVSSDDQKERETIENQVDILHTYLEMHCDDMEMYNEYLDDGISGTVEFVKRPAGAKLIKDASSGLFNTVLVWKVDRFGRDTLSGLKAVEMLTKYNIEILSVTEPFDLNTPTGRFQFITYLNMAELERNNILDRMYLGATRAAKKGKWLGGIVPYGYIVNADGFLEINQDEATIIKKIFSLYTNEKLSTINIAVYLNNLNIPSSCGNGKGKRTKNISGKWRSSSIQRILNSTTYKGIHYYGRRGTRRKEPIPRKVPAIISEDIWNKAQVVKKDNILTSMRNVKVRDYLLRGLIKCEVCKKSYYGISYRQRSSVYSCSGKRGENKKIMRIKCDNVNVNADMIEEQIWNTCLDIIKNYKSYIADIHEKNTTENDDSINLSKLQLDLNNIANEKSNILKLFRKGIIDEKEVNEQLADIKREENKLMNLMKIFKEREDYKCNENTLIKNMSDKLKYYNERLNILSFKDKYAVVHLLVKEIIITPIIDHGEKIPRIDATYNLIKIPPTSDALSVKLENHMDAHVVFMVPLKNALAQTMLEKNIFLNYLDPYLIELIFLLL